jgi:ClpP class serine protease
VDAVASGRGVSSDEVRSGFGQGRILTAPAALAAGMVDRIDTFDATVDRLLAAPAPRTTFAKGGPITISIAHDGAYLADATALHAAALSAAVANWIPETSPDDPAERPSGADKPAPVDGRIARLLNGR